MAVHQGKEIHCLVVESSCCPHELTFGPPPAPQRRRQRGSEFRKNRALAHALLQEPWRGGQMTHEDRGVRCVEKKQQEQVEFGI